MSFYAIYTSSKGGIFIPAQIKFNTANVIKQTDTVAQKRIFKATQYVRGQVLETLSGERSGREYTVPGTSVKYTASAPGQPPAVATSELRESIDYLITDNKREVEGHVGTPLDKGLMLEYGTIHIKPRRWLKPTFERSRDHIKQILTERWW